MSTQVATGELRHVAARGGLLMIATRMGMLALALGSTAVLARLLTPRDFGLMAMASTLLGLLKTIKEMGVANAIVHRQELTDAESTSVFWLNLDRSALLAAGTALAAPAVAWFYGERALLGIIAVLSVGLLATAGVSVHLGMIRRAMRFQVLARVEICAVVAGIVAAVVAAALGAGYWALVLSLLVTQVLYSCGLWALSGWRPGRRRGRLSRHDPGVSELRGYGRRMAWARFADYVGRNADLIVIGRVAGAGPLGLYEKAYAASFLPFRQIWDSLWGVATSAFSRLQDDAARFRQAFRAVARALFTVTFPLLAFLFVEAADVVGLLLGPDWKGAVPLLRILVVAAFAGSIAQLTRWVYAALGETRRELRWTLVSTPCLVVGVIAGIPWGAQGAALGLTAATVLLTYPGLRYCLAASPLTMVDVAATIWRAAVLAVVAGAALAGVALAQDRALGLGLAPSLVLEAVAFSGLYAAGYGATPGGRRHLAETIALVRSAGAAGGRVAG